MDDFRVSSGQTYHQNVTSRNLKLFVLCELSWVLEINYQQSRDQIAHVIEQILQVSQLAIPNADTVWRALGDFRNSNADFSDHLIARINQVTGCEYTLTFDKKAAKQAFFELLKA